MANPVKWHGANKILRAGNQDDRIVELNIFNNGHCSVSCWQLTDEELVDIIQSGGKIYLAVMYGPSQPPVFVGTEDSVRRIAIDFGGVWKKEKVV